LTGKKVSVLKTRSGGKKRHLRGKKRNNAERSTACCEGAYHTKKKEHALLIFGGADPEAERERVILIVLVAPGWGELGGGKLRRFQEYRGGGTGVDLLRKNLHRGKRRGGGRLFGGRGKKRSLEKAKPTKGEKKLLMWLR